MYRITERLAYTQDGDKITFHTQPADSKTGEQVGTVDLSIMASVICDLSPKGEQMGRHGYVLDFLKTGDMLCAGCGSRMDDANQPVGTICYLKRPVCSTCFHDKFKPFFDAMRNERNARV